MLQRRLNNLMPDRDLYRKPFSIKSSRQNLGFSGIHGPE